MNASCAERRIAATLCNLWIPIWKYGRLRPETTEVLGSQLGVVTKNLGAVAEKFGVVTEKLAGSTFLRPAPAWQLQGDSTLPASMFLKCASHLQNTRAVLSCKRTSREGVRTCYPLVNTRGTLSRLQLTFASPGHYLRSFVSLS